MRYPEDRSPLRAEVVESYRRFAELREDYLLDYGYNTARAYWSDLQHLLEWANVHGKDALALDQDDLDAYSDSLRRHGYSENTIRRRLTVIRRFYLYYSLPE